MKDLSRFGRNYIEVGRYLERIFPVMRVRLIAVTDNYDSQSAWKTSDSIMVPMRNLLNDAYCRDISVKIKSQLAVKRKRGDFVGSFATYGYQKDPSNHSKLIVDELAAENVQSIFRWKISGMSNQGIADRLNAGKVPSPAARKLQSGAKLSLHFRKSDEPPWSAKAVDRILHNEVYTGKLVQGKTRRLDYRSKKKMNVPMRDWTIVDNTHEAIIPKEQFELVQRILETETRRPNDAETVALFAGFLYCGDCGSRLVRRSASYKGKKYIYYQCSGGKQNKGSCTSHNLRDEKLYNIVRNVHSKDSGSLLCSHCPEAGTQDFWYRLSAPTGLSSRPLSAKWIRQFAGPPTQLHSLLQRLFPKSGPAVLFPANSPEGSPG